MRIVYSSVFSFTCLVAFGGCSQNAMPDRDLTYWADTPGDPIGGLVGEPLARFERGRDEMDRVFGASSGLGPSFNADSCGSCHQFPVAGGSAPRYRDLFLVRAERDDGAMIDVGTNGLSPVRNLYHMGSGHVAEPDNTTVYARRNSPSGLGIGLFEFVSETEIVKREDPEDKNNDGVSGRANYEQGEVGRFGYKAQAASMESFNRGAFFNQMGITTDPIDSWFPESWDAAASAEQTAVLDWALGGLISTAFAQVSAPDEPTVDEDDAPDPELENGLQMDLLFYSTYLAPLRPAEPDEAMTRGAGLFTKSRCGECHTPKLKSTIGPLYAYSDLLLHDMGAAFENDLEVSLAKPSEFRTQPLWGVSLHGPFLHDGRAETLEDAVLMHGGEADASRSLFEAYSSEERADVVAFLQGLGGWNPEGQILLGPDASEFEVGVNGGPEAGLSAESMEQWRRGQKVFDRTATLDGGLGTVFNADACRACHQDPVLGGAGGVDTNVIRFGEWDGTTYHGFERPVLPRQSLPGDLPYRMDDAANAVEWRNPPTTLGVGFLGRIPDADILANQDPDDLNGDGISGRARILTSGQLGRFGWKAQVPSLVDFAADALLNETGLTIDPSFSAFTSSDDGDVYADPEVMEGPFLDLVVYLENVAPPEPQVQSDAAQVEMGRGLFASSCIQCHTSFPHGERDPYTDLLLHDVAAPDDFALVAQDGEVLPTEFRTPPLWGVVDTGPYLHDGRAETLEAAIMGHHGEATSARQDFEGLSTEETQALVAFLKSL